MMKANNTRHRLLVDGMAKGLNVKWMEIVLHTDVMWMMMVMMITSMWM
jgi:hypothetical protein